MIFLVGFGWAKPVEFRPSSLSSKRFGAAIVALAGPMMNLLLATLAALVLKVFSIDPFAGAVGTFLRYFFILNVFLAVFNLLPLPPLDGSRLLTIFLPPHRQGIIYFLDKYGFIILLGVLLFGGFRFLLPLVDAMSGFILRLTGH